MSDTIGRITVPTVTPTGTFPLKTKYPYGIALRRPTVTHTFGSANAKIEQRFYVGTPAERYYFQVPDLPRGGRTSLRNFWEARKGAEGAFTYAVPQPNGTTVNKTVYFENTPLSLEELTDSITRVGITLCEVPDPAAAPTYALNSTVTRFPSNALATALLDQVQEIIPLVKIRVQDSGVPDIFLSDRRVTIGSQLYLPRLLRIGEQGSEALITQSIAVDGNVPSDDVSFTFGNADRVMTQVANDTNLTWARVEFSLFHVGTGIKIDLWAGYVVPGGWQSNFGPEFAVRCSDLLSSLTLSSPVSLASRSCYRRLGQDGCPYVVGSGPLDLVHFPSASTTTCDYGYNTPNGCMAHQVQTSFGGVYATPQGVYILNKSSAGGGALLRATSLINDTLFGEPLPEIWHDDEGSAQWGLPVKCKIAAGRDESDYYIALGLIGKGPLGALTAPGMWDSNGDGIPDTFIGSTLDGQPNHGYQVTSSGILKPGAIATFGLRYALGSDPAGVNDYFSLGRVAAAIGIGAPRGWYTNPTDSSPMREVAYSASAYNLIYAAGLAFLEIRRSDQPDIQVSLPGTHELIARVSKGLTAYTWTVPGTRTTVAGCTDPFWVAINTYLRACGQLGASAATQETYFDVQAAIDAAAISSAVVSKVFGTGTEKQFQFKGTLDQVRPTRDWIQLILNNAAGYFTWSFGKLRVGCRVNASAASAFTAGNMLFGSLSLEPVRPRFEKLTVKFQDQEYQFAANTVDYTDKDYAARYNRVQNPLAADMELTGTASKSQAARFVTCRSREELGGAVASEQDNARQARWMSTILALETEAGQVVSIADSDIPSGTGNFRILRWTLNRDWSISYEAKTVTASMYDLTVGPKPADVAALPVPTESATEWAPNYETPIASDPLFSAKGFGVKQLYEDAKDGGALASVSIYGDQPADRILQFKARREFVSGICAQVAASISTNTIALGGSGLTVNGYVGRVISKLANASASTATVPIQDFTITANDATGNFTVTPDPAAAGCAAGDLFTIRTKPTAFDATSFTDAGFVNPYNTGGLTAGANRGNLALVIAGTGAGQTPQTVADNTTTKVTVSPGWDVVPDATSVIVLVEASGQPPVQFDQAGGAADSFLGALPVPNYSQKVIRIEGYTQKAAVLGRIESAPFRELYIWGDSGSGAISGVALALVFSGGNGTVGVPYQGALVATGGNRPYNFSLVSGSLAGSGLSLNASTGVISGTPTTATTYSLTFRVTDAASASVDASCSIVISNPPIAGEPTGTVTALTATEVANSVYQDPNGGLHMVVQLSATLTATSFPVRVRTWVDYDDGRGWTLQGDRYADSGSPVWLFGEQTQQTGVTIPGTIWVPVDPTKAAWKAAAEANSHSEQPSGGAATCSFSVTPAQSCPTTDITNIQFVPNATTGDLITYALTAEGVYCWIWNELDYTQPSTAASGDPYFKSSFATVQLGYAATGSCDVSGTSVHLTSGTASVPDVGNLIHIGAALVRVASYVDSTHITVTSTSLNGVSVVNGSGQSYEIWRPAPVDSVNGPQGSDDPNAQAQGYWGRRFTDGPPPSTRGATVVQFIGQPSWTIPPPTLPDGSTNLYRTFRHWVWAVSRLADNEAGGTSTITLQSGWAGAADHYDLVPAQQAAALDLTRTKANTLGRALGKDVFGRPQVNVNGTTPLAVNSSNELYVPIASDFVVQTVGGVPTLSQAFVNLAKSVGFDTSIFGGGGGSVLTINALAVNKLAAGDALFAGQATFASTGGGKVIINSSGVTIQNKITSPTVSVAIGASNMVITGPSGTLTADSTGIAIANGSNSVQVTPSAVAITNSSQFVSVTSSGVTIQYSASCYSQMDSAGFRIVVGPSSVRLTTFNNSLRCPLQPSDDLLMGALAGENIRIVWPALTTLLASAGTLAGYMDFYIGNTQYKVPFYNA